MTHNFTIGGLGFHKLVSDEYPYERATAPFRKEQFDTGPKVGDQSLTGWWTRGQQSFHKGAGVKYYEILDGTGVLDRFESSYAVDCLTTPGESDLDLENQQWFAPAKGFIDHLSHWYIEAHDYQEAGDLYRRSSTEAGSGTATLVELSPGSGRLARRFCYGDASDAELYVIDSSTAGGVYRLASDRTVTKIYSHSKELVGIWRAKDRLWILDAAGQMYAVTARPTTPPVALSSPLFQFTSQSGKFCCTLTATQNSVFVANQSSDLYRIDLDTDGAIPTTAAPVVAATMTAGEIIYHLAYHLGHLLIFTNRGVRAAYVTEGGAVTFGPVIIDRPFSFLRQTSLSESSVYATSNPGSEPGISGCVWEIDLGEQVGDNPLVFAYRKVFNFPSGGDGACPYHGVPFVGPSWWIRAWESSHVYTTNTVDLKSAAEGWLKTGYHRFGTLDDKHFDSVTIRTDGDGFVDVYQVDEDGVETLLGSMNAADKAATFSLTVGATERVALKFVLKRDTEFGGYYTPKFLGYQLRALPAPVRQRLIRVPLMLFDVERGSYGRASGKEGDAWSRLAALEALENGNSVVSFTDHDTGESGTAFIETIEVVRKSATTRSDRSNGFGGVVNVTLRKVS